MGRRGGSFARALLLARKVNFLFFPFFPFFSLFYLFYCSKFELRTPWIRPTFTDFEKITFCVIPCVTDLLLPNMKK
jgi:hypothetical protein